MEFDFLSAFIVGFLGGGHCIAMCGGITTMLTSALPNKKHKAHLPYIIMYNLGRIFSYTFIGMIVGYTGSLAAQKFGLPIVILKYISGIFLIMLGLYLGQWFMGLTKIENIGKYIWQFLSPLSQKLIPVNSISKATLLGVLWGWLPCGLVYSTLTWSLASGSLLNGGLIMLFFGLGTLPALLTMSIGISHLKTLHNNTLFRKFMALLLIIFGVYTLTFATGHMI